MRTTDWSEIWALIVLGVVGITLLAAFLAAVFSDHND